MRHVLLYSLLLVGGLAASQFVPLPSPADTLVVLLTLACLAYIMIHVGLEFRLDKGGAREYGKDYLVAMLAAAVPWVLCAIYFVAVFYGEGSWVAWKESLLGARFASPTSAGVLFSMLAAAGLAKTWTYRKARILAIFDDLDTVLLMIPLQMLIVGLRLELIAVVVLMAVELWILWRWFHTIDLPASWPFVSMYALVLALGTHAVYLFTSRSASLIALHIEVLLPAFVLGGIIRRGPGEAELERETHGPAGLIHEHHVSAAVSAAFMFLVGLSMPRISEVMGGAIDWPQLALHVLAITVLSNLGKLVPVFFYAKEASLRERLAVAIAMFPRGEVGAGVLLISLSYGISEMALLAAMLSMALNLVLTGVFILCVKWLLKDPSPSVRPARQHVPH